MNDVTFIVTTFLRAEQLKQAVLSIEKFVANPKIIIADNGDYDFLTDEFYTDRDFTILKFPYNCGLSILRNLAIEEVKTKYVFMLEDDALFTEDTDVNKLITYLEDNKADLVAPKVINITPEGNETYKFVGDIIIVNDDEITVVERQEQGPTQLVPMIFLAKTEMLLNNKFDNSLYFCEHLDFCLSAMENKYNLHYVPDVSINHCKVTTNSDTYLQVREANARQSSAYFVYKYGLTPKGL